MHRNFSRAATRTPRSLTTSPAGGFAGSGRNRVFASSGSIAVIGTDQHRSERCSLRGLCLLLKEPFEGCCLLHTQCRNAALRHAENLPDVERVGVVKRDDASRLVLPVSHLANNATWRQELRT